MDKQYERWNEFKLYEWNWMWCDVNDILTIFMKMWFSKCIWRQYIFINFPHCMKNNSILMLFRLWITTRMQGHSAKKNVYEFSILCDPWTKSFHIQTQHECTKTKFKGCSSYMKTTRWLWYIKGTSGKKEANVPFFSFFYQSNMQFGTQAHTQILRYDFLFVRLSHWKWVNWWKMVRTSSLLSSLSLIWRQNTGNKIWRHSGILNNFESTNSLMQIIFDWVKRPGAMFVIISTITLL